MENICDPTSDFNFDQLKLVSPAAISSGVYFIRILTNNKQSPFYIQTPKCSTKQGFIKSGKKYYTDLLFKHENESLLNFLESLENYCEKQLFDNRDKWFDSDLTLDEIDSSFTPLTKSYKSGKFFSMRAQVPIRMGKCSLKIFDETENDVDMDNITDTNKLISIIEIQGIRCSSRNFQVDLELKQVMVLNDVDIFEKCVFTKSKPNDELLSKKQEHDILDDLEKLETPNDLEKLETPNDLEKLETSDITNKEDEMKQKQNVIVETVEYEDNDDNDSIVENNNILTLENNDNDDDKNDLEKEIVEFSLPDDEVNIIDTLEKNENLGDLDDLCEVDINVNDNSDEIVIKNKNDIYYQMYKKAKRKAKIAKDLALTSYLQARQIKHTYLEDHPLSDEDDYEEEEELKKIALDEI